MQSSQNSHSLWLTLYDVIQTNIFTNFQTLKNRPNINKKEKFSRSKELSFCNKLKLSNPYIFATWWYKPLIFQTKIVWSNRIHRLKYLRSTIFGCCKDKGIRKFEFVAKTQFLWTKLFFHTMRKRLIYLK